MAKATRPTTKGTQSLYGTERGALERAIAAGSLPRGTTFVADSDDFRKVETPGTYVAEVATDPQAFELLSIGLYREPASAIRELISNAYDADAQNVSIRLDPPHFSKIVIEDDGSGMTLGALRQVIRNVGGSLKRRPEGEEARVTGRIPGFSPGGRPLIGKLGIGLYSVRHMTNHFKIVTKEAHSDVRYTAEVRLREVAPDEQPAETYVAGVATITSERAPKGEHYTRIELLDVTAEAKGVLRSYDRWEQFDASDLVTRRGTLRFHIERLSRDGETVVEPASRPWNGESDPLARFRALVDRLSEPQEMVQTGPAVDRVLDYYYAMLWKISHSAPLAYIYEDPFSLRANGDVDFYPLTGDSTPERLEPRDLHKTVTELTGVSELGVSPTPFNVTIDGVELRRPVLFAADERNYSARQFLRRPKLFVARYDSGEEKRRVDKWLNEAADEPVDDRPLVFSAYFFWAPKIIPKENNGLLVRIRNSSGTGFDHGFLDYRTSELTRIRQISAEIFVEQGMDDALNIDRESFNQSHPHYRTLQRWVTRQLTRIMSRLKADQTKVRLERREETLHEHSASIHRTARDIWAARNEGDEPPAVVVSEKGAGRSAAASSDGYLVIGGVRAPGVSVDRDESLNATLRAISLVLDAHHLLDKLSPPERAQLLSDIAAVLRA